MPFFFGLVAAGLGLAFFSRLPARVPVHFTGAGLVGPKTLAIGIPIAVALGLPVLVLVWRMAPGLSRGTIAGRWLGLLTLATLAVPAAMFYGLARASLKKEWRAAPAAIKRKEMPR